MPLTYIIKLHIIFVPLAYIIKQCINILTNAIKWAVKFITRHLLVYKCSSKVASDVSIHYWLKMLELTVFKKANYRDLEKITEINKQKQTCNMIFRIYSDPYKKML